METADVVVVGAGPAGLAAAITAARKGLQVKLIDTNNKIGGVMAYCPGMMLGAGYPCDESIGGFFEEFVQRLYSKGNAEKRKSLIPEFGPEVIYDHEAAISELYDMLDEAGVELHLMSIPTNVTVENETVKTIEYVDMSGTHSVSAKIFLDCSGNGDIAVKSGVPYKLGNDKGQMMGPTLTFFMQNVDWDRMDQSQDLYLEDIAEKGILERKIHPDIKQIYMVKGLRRGSVFFNTVTLNDINGTNNDDLVKASVEARRRCVQLADYCMETLPGFENAYISYIGPLVGIRETRKLEGLHTVSIEEIGRATKFEDGIVACDNPVDDVFRGGEEFFSNERALEEGKYYTIPFRALVPKKIKNLMFAGRCLSADDLAFASVRGMPQCMLMGQSIGVASKLAIQQNIPVQDINTKDVVREMINLGVNKIG